MIAGDDELMLVRQFRQPLSGGPNFLEGSTFGQIAGVDEHVAVRDVHRVVITMRIRNANQSHADRLEPGLGRSRRSLVATCRVCD